MKSSPSESGNPTKTSGTRLTVTIPPHDYELVRKLAKIKKVSASWVVRDAVEKYVAREHR
ncbi:MAG: ribbon-helix-helix protein, CopG family [Verrucomicrobiota bacterium]